MIVRSNIKSKIPRYDSSDMINIEKDEMILYIDTTNTNIGKGFTKVLFITVSGVI